MTTPLSCLAHVKRQQGATNRPPAPPIHVDVVAVLDRSGSMAPLLPGATAGVRHFLTEQKNRRDGTYVECVTFDDIVEIPYSGAADLMLTADVEKCTHALTARGWTRLYDTAIEAIGRQTTRLEKWRAGLLPQIAALQLRTVPSPPYWTKGLTPALAAPPVRRGGSENKMFLKKKILKK